MSDYKMATPEKITEDNLMRVPMSVYQAFKAAGTDLYFAGYNQEAPSGRHYVYYYEGATEGGLEWRGEVRIWPDEGIDWICGEDEPWWRELIHTLDADNIQIIGLPSYVENTDIDPREIAMLPFADRGDYEDYVKSAQISDETASRMAKEFDEINSTVREIADSFLYL